MELVNSTPLAAASNLSQGFVPSHERFLVVTAKATFAFDQSGHIELDSQNPFPLFPKDIPTPLGLLPTDSLPRADPVFEVILLGKAYAPKGREVQYRRVTLAVGSIRREIDVFGDRVWIRREAFSQPMPFAEMPLQYERAFGGSVDVLVDEKSKFRVADPSNSLGRGFDVQTYMKGLGESLRAPPGYPKLGNYVRHLPNLEDPRMPIRRWEDAPTPVGWATVPPTIGLRMKWVMDRIQAKQPFTEEEVVAHAYHRAHPDWIIPVPPPSAEVEMIGVLPCEKVTFRLPRLRPVIDILNGPSTHISPLVPQMLVLLPEQWRFYLVYRTVVSFVVRPHEDRGLRLRTEERWSANDDGFSRPAFVGRG
ncbi:MAG: DUF2169 domain-containing protein [Polyangia bacterium]